MHSSAKYLALHGVINFVRRHSMRGLTTTANRVIITQLYSFVIFFFFVFAVSNALNTRMAKRNKVIIELSFVLDNIPFLIACHVNFACTAAIQNFNPNTRYVDSRQLAYSHLEWAEFKILREAKQIEDNSKAALTLLHTVAVSDVLVTAIRCRCTTDVPCFNWFNNRKEK